jgi:peroxiredoxin
MIKVGDRLPEGTLTEFIETETAGCSLGPNAFKVSNLVKGKKIAIFGLPGAFTPTCSPKHVPSYLAITTSSKPRAWMKSGASRSTTPSSWAPGAATRKQAERYA